VGFSTTAGRCSRGGTCDSRLGDPCTPQAGWCSMCDLVGGMLTVLEGRWGDAAYLFGAGHALWARVQVALRYR